MGMYTALSLGVELKRKGETPTPIIEMLKYLTGVGPEPTHLGFTSLFSHPFFQCSRWDMVLRCDSYYFDWQTGFKLTTDDMYARAEGANVHDNYIYYLTGVANLKNYGNEINQFLDWLQPYIDTRGFIGWTMYEEDEYPTILMHYPDCEEHERIRTMPTNSTISAPLDLTNWDN